MTTRRVGCVMPGRKSLVVQSIPQRQRARRGLPSPFRTQRGGWISASVPKPPGYDMLKYIKWRHRAQRGGWISPHVPKPPRYDMLKYIKRRRRRR